MPVTERTVCIMLDGYMGTLIWSDSSIDPDLDTLMDYLLDEEEITAPGLYVLECLSNPDGHGIIVEDFGLFTVSETAQGDLEWEPGVVQAKTPKLTTWPPKT